MLKRIITIGMLVLGMSVAQAQAVMCPLLPTDNGTTPYLSIDANGLLTVYAGKVMQTTGTTFYVRALWGEKFIRIIMKANAKTQQITKRFGGAITADTIKQGDIVSFQGIFEDGESNLITSAAWIKDWTDQTSGGSVSGSVTGIDATTAIISAATGQYGNLTISLASTTLKKGARTITVDEIKTGDIIAKATGIYNAADQSFKADSLLLYIDKNIFTPRNFEGTLKSIDSSTAQPAITVITEGKEYSLDTSAIRAILNKARHTTTLSRFLINDKIRFYGAVQELSPTVVRVEILRNLSL